MSPRNDASPPSDTDIREESLSRVLRDPGAYIARAQARAARRRTPSQFAVVMLGFALIGVIWFGLAFGLTRSKLRRGDEGVARSNYLFAGVLDVPGEPS